MYYLTYSKDKDGNPEQFPLFCFCLGGVGQPMHRSVLRHLRNQVFEHNIT